MMTNMSPRFITLTLIITMLLGAYNGIPLENRSDHSEPRDGISSTPKQFDMPNPPFTPLRAHKPVQTGLDRRMIPGGGGPKKPSGGPGGGGGGGTGLKDLLSMMGGGGMGGMGGMGGQ